MAFDGGGLTSGVCDKQNIAHACIIHLNYLHCKIARSLILFELEDIATA